MSDSSPNSEDIVEEIQASDCFSEQVEEIAEHFHEDAYKDERIPEIKASFREDAEEVGLSEGEASSVAGRLIGTLMRRASEQAPPPPESKWDALEPEGGPLPEDRYDELPGPLFRLLRLVETEEKPFRQVHRLIDAIEWAIKWHTTLALSDLLALGDVPDQVKVLLAQSLRTPSLGTWNRFFREATRAFEQIEAEPSLPWTRFEQLTDLESRHHLVSFRNQYGHGATPPPAACRQDVEQYLPVLKELIHTPLFTEIGLAVRGASDEAHLLAGPDRKPVDVDLDEGHAAALLPAAAARETLDLWPLGVCAEAETDSGEAPRFFFFNALKNRSVDQLNYEGPVHRRDEDLYDPFFERLPLRAWREEASAELESFAREVAALTESFKGRREERARLRGFAASGEGTLMVFGAPGIGKSALLAQVVREIEAGVDADGRDLTDEDGNPVDPPPVIEYFIRRSEGRDDPVRFLRYLCRHLDERYDLDGQGLGSEPVELQEQLSARLQAIEESADYDPKRMVLLVDGLDEAPELGKYVPEARPWLPVIVASRETLEATDFYEGRRREARSQVTVGPLGTREVRAILYEGANKYDPAFNEEYVEAVAERSEGNPLYLTLLAEELFQGKIEVGDIDALPDKIGELYGEALRRVTDEGENETALDLLHLLAEAKAPLTAGAIAELLEINAMQADSAVRSAMELLHETNPEALYPTRGPSDEELPEAAVQLFHESLREWLREEHAVACRAMRKRLAEKTAAWTERREETARRYALRYGAVHQREAGNYDELYNLLTGESAPKESYPKEQVRTFKQFDATYAAYEAGLQAYVERDGETPEDDARLCRLALDAGTAAREATEGVTQAFRWAEEGRMEDALQRIEVLGEEKYFLAALRLLWIEADRQAEKPEEERSAEKAQKVLDAVEERIPPGTAAIDWSEFVDEDFMAWWAGRVLQALPDVEVTRVLKRTSDRATALRSVASDLADADQHGKASAAFDQALEAARSIDDDFDRAKALRNVASTLADADQHGKTSAAFDRALEAARSIGDDSERAKALRKVASDLADADQHGKASAAFDQALEAARSTDDDYDRAMALYSVASDLAETGAFERAFKVARSINLSEGVINFRATALRKVASDLAETGAFDRALEVARSIDDDFDRATALQSVASDLADADQHTQASAAFDQALEVAQSISSDRLRAHALRDVASALAEAGQSEQAENAFDQALEVAQSITPSEGVYNERTEALRNLASGLAETDDFERALKVARSIVHDASRTMALHSVASILTETGAFEQALEVARSIDDDSDRATALQSVASDLADADQHGKASAAFDQALEVAQSITPSEGVYNERAEALRNLASDLAETGAFDQALEVARSITPSEGVCNERATALRSVTSGLAEAGAFDQALEVARSIVDDSKCAEALRNLASDLAETGAFDQALEVARSITPSEGVCNERATALRSVTSGLAEAGAFDQALEVARSIVDDSARAHALRDVASALAEADQHGKASAAFDQALEAVRSIVDDFGRAMALHGVATGLAETGAFDQALEVARSINPSEGGNNFRAEALRKVASDLAETGAFEQALEVARSVDDDFDRATALRSVASNLADADQHTQASAAFDRALKVTRSIDDDSDRATALRSVASDLAENGAFDRALEVARSIDDDFDRATALRNVASTLADADQHGKTSAAFDQALQAARSINVLSERTFAVEEIAEKQAEDDQADAFADHLPTLELLHSGWTDFLSTWREALLEHEEDPRTLLRQSLTLYPFDAEAAAEGAYSLVQAHVQAGAMDLAEAIARECPELDLDVLVSEPGTPIPEGCDPDDLPVRQRAEYDTYVELYEEGTLDDAAFESKVEELFEEADLD